MDKLWQTLRERQDLLIGLVIGAATGWIISTAPGWAQASSYKSWWDIATAVGTVGAVVVALALALRDERRRRREAITKARLVAASVSARLLGIHFELLQLAETWERDISLLANEENRKSAGIKIDGLIKTVDFAEVEALAAAPENIAADVMKAYQQLRLVITGFGYPVQSWTVELNNAYSERIRHAVELIDAAKSACDRYGIWR